MTLHLPGTSLHWTRCHFLVASLSSPPLPISYIVVRNRLSTYRRCCVELWGTPPIRQFPFFRPSCLVLVSYVSSLLVLYFSHLWLAFSLITAIAIVIVDRHRHSHRHSHHRCPLAFAYLSSILPLVRILGIWRGSTSKSTFSFVGCRYSPRTVYLCLTACAPACGLRRGSLPPPA